MKHTLSPALLAALLILTSGCAGVGIYETMYEAQRIHLEPAHVSLGALIADYVATQGWRIRAADSRIVEAVTPGEEIAGMEIRSRWFFFIQPDGIAVRKHLEARFDPRIDEWTSSTQVCRTYEYQTERGHLAALEKYVRARTAVAAAALSQLGMGGAR